MALERKAGTYRILTTLPRAKVDFWNRLVHTVGPRPNRLAFLASKVGIPDSGVIPRLLAGAPRADIVLLAGGERADIIYLAIAGLLPWIRTPHIIVDAHWQKAPGLVGSIQRLLLRAGRRLLVEVQPHSHEEIEIYHREFGIAERVLRPVPWSTSLIGYVFPDDLGSERPFILSGGHSFRDYPPLIHAAGALGITLKIGIARAAVTTDLRRLVDAHPNVELHCNWNNSEYYRQIAACSVFAMPIEQGLTRSTADQTILNAMYLGKPVVATDSIGPRIYMRHGVNGFLVREPSADAWEAALARALSLSPDACSTLASEAAFDARVRFNEVALLGRILDNALAILDPSHRPDWSRQLDERLVLSHHRVCR